MTEFEMGAILTPMPAEHSTKTINITVICNLPNRASIDYATQTQKRGTRVENAAVRIESGLPCADSHRYKLKDPTLDRM